MKNFVRFFAEGLIYERDKNGNPCGVKAVRRGGGVVLDDAELTGKIFRQCPNLLPCDTLQIQTYPIC